MQLTLSHDGHLWRARDGDYEICAQSLAGLDEILIKHLREAGHTDWPVNAVMYFDRSTLPNWMGQYAGHYFNRCVRLDSP